MTPAGIVTFAATTFIGVAYSNTISAGVLLLAGVVSIGTVAGVIRGVRWKSAYEAERAVREAGDDRIRGLAHERDDYKAKLEEVSAALAEARETIHRLEALPNMAKVLELVTESFERLVGRQEAMHTENKIDGDRRLQILLEEFRADRSALLDEVRAERHEFIEAVRGFAA
jgi:hypothetical protein